ncbi:MAG: CinA family protein [Litorilinea sp.]
MSTEYEATTQDDLVAMAGGIRTAMCNRNLTLATAESCTGGLIGHVVTEVSGCSDFFVGAGVVYNYPAKENVLGVDHDTLLRLGAVSAEVASQMAHGARKLYGADVAVSVTGIAGPGGGTAEKPTGTTYLHLTGANGEVARLYVWQGNRTQNKLASARAALEMILEYLEKPGN